jgi:hypothetical protein
VALLEVVATPTASPMDGMPPLDPRAYGGELEQGLAVLHNAMTGAGEPWKTAAFISMVLREEFGIAISLADVAGPTQWPPAIACDPT